MFLLEPTQEFIELMQKGKVRVYDLKPMKENKGFTMCLSIDTGEEIKNLRLLFREPIGQTNPNFDYDGAALTTLYAYDCITQYGNKSVAAARASFVSKDGKTENAVKATR